MIKGKTITLSLVEEKHLEQLYHFHSDISNRGDYCPIKILPQPLFFKKFQETGFWTDQYSQLLIFDNKEIIVGSIWATSTISNFSGIEIGYLIYDKKNSGKGYMTEALSLFVNYLFSLKNSLNRIVIHTLPDNIASEKVALKCGFTFEGIARGFFFFKGKYNDLRQFSLLRSDLVK